MTQPGEGEPPEPAATDFIGARDLTHWRSRVGSTVAKRTVAASHSLRAGTVAGATRLPYVVLGLVSLLGLLCAALATAASAIIYDNVSEKDGSAVLDQPVLDQMIQWRTPARNDLVTYLTTLGSPAVMPLIATAAALMLAWWWRRWTPLVLMAVTAGGALTMTIVGKVVVDRVRPAHSLGVPPYESSPSFPSGHSLNSWVIFAMIAYLVVCRWGSRAGRTATVMLALMLAVAMGLSRVYLGHHWLTDVLVAWALGTAWLSVVITAHRLALTVQRHRQTARLAGAAQS